MADKPIFQLVDRDTCLEIKRLERENKVLKEALQAIADNRNEFGGCSLDYMQGYRDGQEYQAQMARAVLDSPQQTD